MQYFAINTDLDAPLKTKHVCYFVTEKIQFHGGRELVLNELVENTYYHPETKEMTIDVLEIKPCRQMKKAREQGALILLDAAEKNIKNINPD